MNLLTFFKKKELPAPPIRDIFYIKNDVLQTSQSEIKNPPEPDAGEKYKNNLSKYFFLVLFFLITTVLWAIGLINQNFSHYDQAVTEIENLNASGFFSRFGHILEYAWQLATSGPRTSGHTLHTFTPPSAAGPGLQGGNTQDNNDKTIIVLEDTGASVALSMLDKSTRPEQPRYKDIGISAAVWQKIDNAVTKPVIISVHGTFDSDADDFFRTQKTIALQPAVREKRWWQIESDYNKKLYRAAGFTDEDAIWLPFHWSGKNNDADRDKASQNLSRLCAALSSRQRNYALIGHSHGGNVIDKALGYYGADGAVSAHCKAIITYATPFFKASPKSTLRIKANETFLGQAVIAFGLWATIAYALASYFIPAPAYLPLLIGVLTGPIAAAIMMYISPNEQMKRHAERWAAYTSGKWTSFVSTDPKTPDQSGDAAVNDEVIAGLSHLSTNPMLVNAAQKNEETKGEYITDKLKLNSDILKPIIDSISYGLATIISVAMIGCYIFMIYFNSGSAHSIHLNNFNIEQITKNLKENYFLSIAIIPAIIFIPVKRVIYFLTKAIFGLLIEVPSIISTTILLSLVFLPEYLYHLTTQSEYIWDHLLKNGWNIAVIALYIFIFYISLKSPQGLKSSLSDILIGGINKFISGLIKTHAFGESSEFSLSSISTRPHYCKADADDIKDIVLSAEYDLASLLVVNVLPDKTYNITAGDGLRHLYSQYIVRGKLPGETDADDTGKVLNNALFHNTYMKDQGLIDKTAKLISKALRTA